MAPSTSLSAAVSQAVSFLTRSLVKSYSSTTVSHLQLILESNLTSYYAPTWVPHAPSSGSGRRCLTLSQSCLPPRVIYSACLSSGVQWFDWIKLIGLQEFDLVVDPACVYVRVGHDIFNVWAPDQVPSRTASKTAAQHLLENDTDAGIFDLIADEMNAPTWMTPMADTFPRSVSPLSRCSSRSSNSSSGFSMSSGGSESSASSVSSKHSKREKTKTTTRVYIDTSKTEVTPYDGGKTTVLTGGVMLGGGPVPRKHGKAPSGSWRTVEI